ncbi:DUF6750 family protein, partial [Escherichia coli]
PSISDGRLSYQFSSDGYIRRSVYAYRNVGEGAKTAQSSSITIAQFIGVILFLGGLIGLKKVGKQGGMGLAGCIVSIVIGAVLVAGPEMMSRSQKQLGISSISIG